MFFFMDWLMVAKFESVDGGDSEVCGDGDEVDDGVEINGVVINGPMETTSSFSTTGRWHFPAADVGILEDLGS